ncbi:MAG: hypothetical protein U0941_15705 [Planctomycetaceae bacterium]
MSSTLLAPPETSTSASERSTVDKPAKRLEPREPNPRTNSGIRAYILPVAVGLVLRTLVSLVWLGGTDLNNDAADYYSEAVKIFDGTREPIPSYWPPGTSYYLVGWFAVLGVGVGTARVAMIVLSTLQIAVTGLLTFEATRNRRTAILASWIWALYPPSVLLVGQTYSQHLACFALACSALFGMKWINSRSSLWLLPLGISLGVGTLTRPSMMSVLLITLAVVFVLSLLGSEKLSQRISRAIFRAIPVALAAGLVIVPTILQNAQYGGGYSLSTNNERNFFIGNNPHTPWYKTSHFAQRTLQELPVEVQEYLVSHYEAPDRRAAMKQAAMRHIMENPGLAVLRTANRARSFWGFDYLATRSIQATYAAIPKIVAVAVLLAEAGGYALVMICALLGLFHFSGKATVSSTAWYLAAILAYAAPYCIAFSSGTYHYPVMGIVAVFAAIGARSIWESGWKSIVAPTRVWLVLFAFVAIQVEYAYFTMAAW